MDIIYPDIDISLDEETQSINIDDTHNLSQKLKNKIFTQDKAIDSLVNYIKKILRFSQESEMIRYLKKLENHEINLIYNDIDTSFVDEEIQSINIDDTHNLSQKLKNKIFAQDEAIDSLVNYINIRAVGLNDKEKPIGTFLFTGPTGVGKTELAKQLSIEMNMHFQRFDMSEFSSEGSADNLIGGAAGLVGYEEGGLLTNAIKQNPRCVLLFDEVEKADRSVINKFLQILDYGKLTSSKGEEVYFNETIVIFTSNLNAVYTVKRSAGFNSTQSKEYENDMDDFLSPEFRARINEIIHFNSLDKNTSKMIIKKSIDEINTMLEEKNIYVEVSDSFIEGIYKSINHNLGARDIQNLINKNVKSTISQEIISSNLTNESIITFDWDSSLDNHSFKIIKTEKQDLSEKFSSDEDGDEECEKSNPSISLKEYPF